MIKAFAAPSISEANWTDYPPDYPLKTLRHAGPGSFDDELRELGRCRRRQPRPACPPIWIFTRRPYPGEVLERVLDVVLLEILVPLLDRSIDRSIESGALLRVHVVAHRNDVEHGAVREIRPEFAESHNDANFKLALKAVVGARATEASEALTI